MKDALCRAFCEALTIREVKAGLAVGTGFKRSGGDRIGFYVTYEGRNRARARVEDDGLTVPMLEAAEVPLSSGPRGEQFAALLRESGVLHDEDENLLHTPYVPLDWLPALALDFVAFQLRVQDFVMLSRERIEETLKDDVVRAVRERFTGRASVYVDQETKEALPGTPCDVVIAAPGKMPLAVFVGTSEPKALEATLLWSDIKAKEARPAKVMLVLETPKPRFIRTLTLSRAMNRFQVTVFPGFENEVLNAMERDVFNGYPGFH